jgi:hypothetical protein
MISLPSLQLLVWLIEAHWVLCEERFECNADFLFIGGYTSRQTSSVLLIRRKYDGHNNANPCNFRGPNCLTASNFFLKGKQIS